GAFSAAVGYLAWSYYGEPDLAAEPAKSIPKLEASWLDPKIEPTHERNPFLTPASEAAIARAKAEKAQADGKTAPSEESGPTPPELTLGAVMIRGGSRAAILNGRVYRPGDRLVLGTG